MHSVHPVLLIAIVGGLFSLAAIVGALFVRSNVVKSVMILLAVVCMLPGVYMFLAANPGLVDARFRAYHAFYRDIEIGMTRAEVFANLEKHYPTNGPRLRPKLLDDTAEGVGFFMNPEDAIEPNCEGIFLTFERGRLTHKTYSAD
jgi:hypothetical protein